jgi:UDP-glucose 4-epimerase
MRALVTGGAGFIGSHVAEQLLGHGYSVTVLDNLSTGRSENVPRGAQLVQHDVVSADAIALVREGRFNVIAHLAAQANVRRSVADPIFDASVNILGTLHLLEGVRSGFKTGHVTRFIFSSTGGALYGDHVVPPHDETVAKNPISPYGVAKHAAECYLSCANGAYGLESVVLRYANVYGPRQDPHGEAGVVAIFCERLVDRQPLTVFGDGRQTRDFVSVTDVARANLAAATHPLQAADRLDARAFNIGTGVETSVLELAAGLIQAAGDANARSIRHAPPRAGEQQRSAVTIDKAAALLGWRPTVPLAAGLAETFQWFESRRGASQQHDRSAPRAS